MYCLSVVCWVCLDHFFVQVCCWNEIFVRRIQEIIPQTTRTEKEIHALEIFCTPSHDGRESQIRRSPSTQTVRVQKNMANPWAIAIESTFPAAKPITKQTISSYNIIKIYIFRWLACLAWLAGSQIIRTRWNTDHVQSIKAWFLQPVLLTSLFCNGQPFMFPISPLKLWSHGSWSVQCYWSIFL